MSSWSGGEPGLMAVRAKFGPQIEQQIRLWPKLAEAYAIAEYRDDRQDSTNIEGKPWQSYVRAKVAAAESAVARARRDKDYALEQAAAVARNVHNIIGGLGAVPNPRQIRREWGWE